MKAIERKHGYLLIEYDEPFKLNEVIALIQEVGQICRQEGYSKVLADLSRAPSEISTMDGFKLGLAGAGSLSGVAKTAVVSRSRLVRFVENVGVNRGGNVRMFSELDKAMAWLDIEDHQIQ